MKDTYFVGLFLRISALCTMFAVLFVSVILLCEPGVFREDKDEVAKLADALQSEEAKYPPLVIDAGHGGEDGGAVSPSGICEKDVNLDIALTLYAIAESFGLDAVLTRSEDKLLYSDRGEGSRKMQDLKNRLAVADSAGDCIFISIHQNKFPLEYCKGFQAYFSANDPESERLAEHFRSAVVEHLQSGNQREIKRADQSIYLLDRADFPAVLLECGFLSNPEDEAKLSDGDYRKKLSCVLFVAIGRYFE